MDLFVVFNKDATNRKDRDFKVFLRLDDAGKNSSSRVGRDVYKNDAFHYYKEFGVSRPKDLQEVLTAIFVNFNIGSMVLDEFAKKLIQPYDADDDDWRIEFGDEDEE